MPLIITYHTVVLLRHMPHLPKSHEENNLNRVLRDHYAYYGIAVNIHEQFSKCIGICSDSGIKCFVAGPVKSYSLWRPLITMLKQ